MDIAPITAGTGQAAPRQKDAWEAAKTMEATFLSEMLKAAKFGEARDAFGGGVGEDQFSSFLVDAHATAMVEAGGIGLAEAIYASLTRKTA